MAESTKIALPTGWMLRLHGDEMDLALLARHSPIGRFVVIHEPELGYLMTSDQVRAAPSAREASDLAVADAAELWGICRLADRLCPPFHLGPVFSRRADGKYDTTIVAEAAHLRLRLFPPTIVVGTNVYAPDPPIFKMYGERAATDERIHRALWLYGLPDATSWVGLYRVLEVIEEDLGKIPSDTRAGWPSATRRKLFERTANSFQAVGGAARHGHTKRQPPKSPMPIEEARELIASLLAKWISEK
jgi:hypothetical protein